MGANRLALPVVFGAAAALNLIGINLLGFVMSITYHEFGHAAASWLGGRWAVPIPVAALTFTGSDRSWLVAALLFAAVGWLAERAQRERRWPALTLCSAVLLAQIAMMAIASRERWQMWMVWSGCAGELVFGALGVIAFYHRVSERLRWDFWRYPVLAVSASRDSGNDMVRLVKEHGLSPQAIRRSYVLLAQAGAAAIALHYLWFLLFAGARPPAPPEASPPPL